MPPPAWPTSKRVLLACALSCALFAAAMVVYPGGSWTRPDATSHDFLRNFLCDLTWRTAHNGAPNGLGATLASAAMMALAVGLWSFWPGVSRLFQERSRLGSPVRRLGALSSAALFVLPLLPTGLVGPHVHAGVVYSAALPGLVASFCTLTGLAYARERRLVLLGSAAWLAALVSAGLYTHQLATRAPVTVWLTGTQRLASLLFLAWLGLSALRMQARERAAHLPSG